MPQQVPAEAGLKAHRRDGRIRAGSAGLALLGLICIAPGSASEADPQAVERGRYLATAANCVGCHTEPGGVEYAGGRALKTPFGIFYGPNITPHPEAGIGRWSDADFLNALKQGIAPEGHPYYPAFPYTSFAGITDADALAIKAFLFSLPPSDRPSRSHELSFPYSVRLTVWPWRWLFFEPESSRLPEGASPQVSRGAYLVEALGHCGECHTPRNWLGARNEERNLAGTVDGPEGEKVPNITPDSETGLGSWSTAEVIRVLESGLLPDFDVVGGPMGEVVRATSKLDPADRAAIAAYLESVRPIHNPQAPATQPEF
ncbi:MAG TPA: cytochrome c [Alphaproteobacteria bacterium]|nr:cytochrome c [Alphaproteobacteria bacterium]